MNNYNMKQYQANQINTASPEQILIMLYDGAIRFTRQAIKGVETERPDERRHGISKAMAIITEFSNSLDHSIGGKIAEDLDALYDFMIRELTQANIHSDVEKLIVIERLLVDLRETWGEAVEISRKELANAVAAKAPEENSYTPLTVSR